MWIAKTSDLSEALLIHLLFQSFTHFHSLNSLIYSFHSESVSSTHIINEPTSASSPESLSQPQSDSQINRQPDSVKVLITPYAGLWDRHGLIGNFLQPLEHLMFLPPVEISSIPRYPYYL